MTSGLTYWCSTNWVIQPYVGGLPISQYLCLGGASQKPFNLKLPCSQGLHPSFTIQPGIFYYKTKFILFNYLFIIVDLTTFGLSLSVVDSPYPAGLILHGGNGGNRPHAHCLQKLPVKIYSFFREVPFTKEKMSRCLCPFQKRSDLAQHCTIFTLCLKRRKTVTRGR